MLVAGVVSGAIAILNQTNDQSKNTWIYIVVGITGLLVTYVDLSGVIERAKILAQGLGELSNIFGGGNHVSILNFIGSGLYLVGAGSVGLLISGLGIIVPQSTNNLGSNEVELKNVTAPKYAKERVDERTQEEIENENFKNKLSLLNKYIWTEKHKLIGGGMTSEINTLINELCTSKSDAIYLISTYESVFQSNLIEELIEFSSNYSAIKKNVSKFIELDIIEPEHPHKRK